MSDIDAYLALGPLHAPASAPPAAPANTPAPAAEVDTDGIDDEVEDTSLPAATPDEPGRGSATDPAAEGDEDDDEDEGTDQDWLIERARMADEYEALLARQDAERKQAEAVAYWDDRLEQANSWFATREAQIYADADNSLNPVGYLRTELSKLHNEANVWYAEYRDNREAALWQFAQAQAIPNHAARVVEHYKLPKEAINELLDYPPDLMEREAQKMRARLIRERNRQKEIDQLKRKSARRAIEANPLTTGVGRAAGGGGDLKLGSDQHYHAIPWVRGR